MNNVRYYYLFLLLACTVTQLLAQTPEQRAFLLKQYQLGMDKRVPEIRKYQVWNVSKVSTPAQGNWTVKINKAAVDPKTLKPIDWGKNNDRYLKIAPVYNTAKYPGALANGAVRDTSLDFVVMLNLYEKDGTLVKTLSRWGNIIGISAANWIYEAEGKTPLLITYETVTPGTNFTYGITGAKAIDMYFYMLYDDPVVLQLDYASLRPNHIVDIEKKYAEWQARKAKAYVVKLEADEAPIERARQALITDCPLFGFKFDRTQVYDTYHDSDRKTNSISGFMPMIDCYTGNELDWGNTGDRYLQFVPVFLKKSVRSFELKDDVYRTGHLVVLTLNLYEKNGTFVKNVAWGGGCLRWAPSHIFFTAENHGVLFTPKKFKYTPEYTPQIYSYGITAGTYPADKLSFVTGFNAYDSFK